MECPGQSFRLAPSRRLLYALCALHLAALAGLAATALPPAVMLALAVLFLILFGVGWGLAGICPGPALVLIGAGLPQGVLFVAAMLAGMGVFEVLERLSQAGATKP